MLSDTQVIYRELDSMNHSWETNHSPFSEPGSKSRRLGFRHQCRWYLQTRFLLEPEYTYQKQDKSHSSLISCVFILSSAQWAFMLNFTYTPRHVEIVQPFTKKVTSFASSFFHEERVLGQREGTSISVLLLRSFLLFFAFGIMKLHFFLFDFVLFLFSFCGKYLGRQGRVVLFHKHEGMHLSHRKGSSHFLHFTDQNPGYIWVTRVKLKSVN